jgi:hypothetical protein
MYLRQNASSGERLEFHASRLNTEVENETGGVIDKIQF